MLQQWALLPLLGMAWLVPTSKGAQTLRPEAQRNIPHHLNVYLFHKFSCIKNVTHIILVMQNHSKWLKVSSSCQDYRRIIVAVSWHIKWEGFYLIIVQWSGWEVNIKCKTNAMQKECKALVSFSLYGFVALAHSVILNPSIATADVLSPPSLVMYIWQF